MEPWEVIHTYTRKDALQDGNLYDVTELGRLAGFSVPVAVTALVHGICRLRQTPGDGQVDRWYLRKVIQLARLHASYERNRNSREFLFEVSFLDTDQERHAEQFKCVLGPDDDGLPCVTIMIDWED